MKRVSLLLLATWLTACATAPTRVDGDRQVAVDSHSLLGEIAIERQEFPVAASEFLAAAMLSDDPALAERATRIAHQLELTDACPGTPVLLGSETITIMGDTVPANPDAAGMCCGNTSGEYIFAITPQASGTLHAEMSTNYPPCLWIRETCPSGPDLACDDVLPVAGDVPVTAGKPYYLGIDGVQGAEGMFSLSISLQMP